MKKFLKYIRKNNNTYAGRCIKCSRKFYVFTKTFWESSLLPSPRFYFVDFNYANFWKFLITAIFKGNSELPILTITFPNNHRSIRSEVFSDGFRGKDNSALTVHSTAWKYSTSWKCSLCSGNLGKMLIRNN